MNRKPLIGAVLSCLLAGTAPCAYTQSVKAVPKFDQDSLIGSWYEIARLPNRREKHCASNAIELIALGDKPTQLQIVDACIDIKGYKDSWNFTATSKTSSGALKVRTIFPLSRKYWVLALGPVVPVNVPPKAKPAAAAATETITAHPASESTTSVAPDATVAPPPPASAVAEASASSTANTKPANAAPPPPATGYAWSLIGTPNHKNLWIFARTATLSAADLDQIKAQAAAQGFNLTRLYSSPQSSLQ